MLDIFTNIVTPNGKWKMDKPKERVGLPKGIGLNKGEPLQTPLYHACVQYGKRCKSHNMQALLGLSKVLLPCKVRTYPGQ